VLRLLVPDGAAEDFIHRFGHDKPLARRQSDERIGPLLDVLNQLSVEDEDLTA
jgi:hypothetical protein